MTTKRKPRKPMLPTLTERDRAAIRTTVKQSGLASEPTDGGNSTQESPTVGAPTPKEAPEPTTTPKQTSVALPGHDKKALRVSVAPSSELAEAVRAKIRALSPDAQKFVTTATLLREFLNVHDVQLAKLFREEHDL